jgi:NADPH-dependent ferric siderophore reductase
METWRRERADAMRTALERPFPLVEGEIAVSEVERPAERLARITFEGPELADLPDEQPGEIVTFAWGPHQRNFTIRAYDRDRAAIVVDFVLHGDRGRASAWARRAGRGDRLRFSGPRAHYFDDPRADWVLLAGDETALPSIVATLERAPVGQRVIALVDSDGTAAEHSEIATRADATVEWLERDGPPHRSRALEQAVRELDLPDGRGKVWVAGEAGVVRGLRVHLRDERGLEIGPRQAVGYWKHRQTPDDVERDVA